MVSGEFTDLDDDDDNMDHHESGGADISETDESLSYSDSDSDSSIDYDTEDVPGWNSFEFVMLAVDYEKVDFQFKGLYRKQAMKHRGYPQFKNR